MVCGFCSADTRRHIVGDHRDFAFHVTAPFGIAERDIVAWTEEGIAPPLIHQGIAVETLRHFRAACLANQFDMIDIGAAIGPLIGAGQGGFGQPLVKAFAGDGLMLDIAVERFQLGCAIVPVVERRLQGRGDIARLAAAGEVFGNHDKTAVTGVVLQGSEFHMRSSVYRPFVSSPSSNSGFERPVRLGSVSRLCSTRTELKAVMRRKAS